MTFPNLGPRGPFPDAPMAEVLERRWLHYAFLSRDGQLGLVANLSRLGPDSSEEPDDGREMSILLVHHRTRDWSSSQFNARVVGPPWSAFSLPHPYQVASPFKLSAVSGDPAVDLALTRTSRPCSSHCAPFAWDHHLRWQSESGVVAEGTWRAGGETYPEVSALGYHERVRGRWGWPELGGWVFGFANDTSGDPGAPPPTALVFPLIQPLAPASAATGSVMVWRDGRQRQHFARRVVDVAVRGTLDRDSVAQVPELANVLGTGPTAPIPRRLLITAQSGDNWVLLDFECESAARIVIPSETGLAPFSVHEVIGTCQVEGRSGGADFGFISRGIVEFAGGARTD